MDEIQGTLEAHDRDKRRPAVTRRATYAVGLTSETHRTRLHTYMGTDGSAVVIIMRDGYCVWSYTLPAEGEDLFGR